MKATYSISILAALALAGCAGLTGSATRTEESLVTASAVVEAVDLDSREVLLRGTDGEPFSVTAGPEVRNLPQVEPGDVVTVDFYEAVTLAMAEPGADTDAGAIVAGRAPEGARPGGLLVATETMVVEVVSYDANSGLATVIAPDGSTRRVTVAPAMREFASQRRRGDRVEVTITQAVAVTITETAG